MKSFQEIFPSLRHSKNHAVYLLEEAFNRYYEALETQEERNKLILDFKNLIGKSEIESINFCAPLKIEKDKLYFISDIFSDGDFVDEVHKALGGEIYRGGIGVLDNAAIVAFNEDASCIAESDDDADFEDVSVTDEPPSTLDSSEISNFMFNSDTPAAKDDKQDSKSNPKDKEAAASPDSASMFGLFDPNLQYSESPDLEEMPVEKPESIFDNIPSSASSGDLEQAKKTKEDIDKRLMQIANNHSQSKNTEETQDDGGDDDFYGEYGEDIEAMRNGEDIGNGLVVYKRQYKEEDYIYHGSN